LKIFKSLSRKKFFLYLSISGLCLSLFTLLLHFFLPTTSTSSYYTKSLNQLRQKAASVKKEFSQVIEETNIILQSISLFPFPQKKEDVFALFKSLQLDTEKEGVGYYNDRRDLILWHGNVFDLKNILENNEKIHSDEQGLSYLIHNKASYYLIILHPLDNDEYIAIYRLMAFLPQFKAHYLREYHFLKPNLLRDSHIDYWDFREDLSGFEKIFTKHKDEYIGQPSLQGEIQTLFFPLRNKGNKIIATVTLRSPSLSSKLSNQKESMLLAFYFLFGLSLVFLLIYLAHTYLLNLKRKKWAAVSIILILIGVRLIFFPLSQLEKVQSLPFFSPSTTSFLSIWNLTKSPADIFLTSLLLFFIIGCLAILFRDIFERQKGKCSTGLSLVVNSFAAFIALSFVFFFQEILLRLVFHSNLNLLALSFQPSSILLHLSILFFFSTFILASLWALRTGYLYSHRVTLPLVILLLALGGYIFMIKGRNSFLLFFLQVVLIILIFTMAQFPKTIKKKEFLFSVFFVSSLLIYTSIHNSTSDKNRALLQNSLQNIIKSQEPWGNFLIKQSLPEIDTKKESIIFFFNNSESMNIAHSLWERTLIAKFNWYSSLEMLSPEGIVLSRFSLNVPEFYRLNFDDSLSPEWSIIHRNIPFMGKEKDFLIAYKDWFEKEDHIGRIVVYLSVDYDMLPFLYSANPYYELLRITSIPSLNQLDLGFAIFDFNGQLLFNPDKISSGIPADLLEKIRPNTDSTWSSFVDKNKTFNSLFFKHNNRIYSLFLPKKNFIDSSIGFLKLFFHYFFIFILITFLLALMLRRDKLKNPFWSFSNRVYISFVVIALIPLFLFTFSTRNFFARIFTQQFTEKAEIHADFAKRVMDDFIYLQQEEQVTLTLPPDNVVIAISLAISNDVNLYQDGRIISSSRQEFFDYGFYPELIDGEIFYQIQYENNLFYTQTQKIGDYSFHTLTVPYSLQDALLLISLPFPLEQQEISKASAEMIEFLLFISFFFIVIVLFLARGIGGMIVTPIKRLLLGTKEVSLGNLEISISHKHQDEMKTLIDGFNTMVENLKKHQHDLADMSKKVAWAEMARKVAHEIKNPLTPIQLSAEHLLTVYDDKKENFKEALKESVSYIIKEVENLRKIAHEFLEISRETGLKKEAVDLRDIVRETIEPYKNLLSGRIPIVESFKGDQFSFSGDKAKLKIALRNIFTNAIEAIHEDGEIKIDLSSTSEFLLLKVEDTGIGMKNDILTRIFEPYFSTKKVGTGLGLSIAKKIIEAHGGSIHAASKENEGTQILIKLPKSNAHDER